jgi:hypothetical protein
MEYDYINTVQKKQVISKEKYLPIQVLYIARYIGF